MTPRAFRAFVTELQGRPIWAARRGFGTSLTFDMGERRTVQTKNENREVGSHHLRVYLARWTLYVGTRVTNWDSPSHEIEQALRAFEGSSIVGIDTQPTVVRLTGSTRREIELFPQEDAAETDEMLLVYVPEHRVLTVRANDDVFLGDSRSTALDE